jgi:hypothetical protein
MELTDSLQRRRPALMPFPDLTSTNPAAFNLGITRSSRRKPPEPLVFSIDRSLGRKKVPEALRAAGLDVRVHDELFAQATEDVAVLAAKLRFLQYHILALTGDEAATLIWSAMGAMTRLRRRYAKAALLRRSRADLE